MADTAHSKPAVRDEDSMIDIKQYIVCWSKALSKLELDLVEITTQELGINMSYDVLPLLQNFGGEKGMLLFPEGTKVLPVHHLLSEQGYGYSVVDCPISFGENLQDNLILLLKDWTWTGARCSKPEWLF